MIPTLLLALFAPQGARWTPLPTPAPCVPVPREAALPALLDGRHVLVRAPKEPSRLAPAADLPASLLPRLIGDELRRRSMGVALLGSASPLLASGDPEGVEQVRAWLAALDAVRPRLSVELSATLAPAGEAPIEWHRTAPTGAEVVLGSRRTLPFLADFSVEVATDAGVAQPELGAILLGRTLHLSASPTVGGDRWLVRGLLDLAELEGWETFDPDTADLGLLRQPRVRSVQVAFSGAVDAGEPLVVELAGVPIAPGAFTLSVRAAAQGPGDADPTASPWEVLDLSLLTGGARAIPPLSPGVVLDGMLRPAALPRLVEPLPPSAFVASLAEGRRRGEGALPVWSDRLLFLPRSDEPGVRAARGLAAAFEAERLVTRTVRLAWGDARVVLPTAYGEHARVAILAERTWLVDYQIEIAPDSWMPAPTVREARDGLVWQGVLAGDVLTCDFWIADTPKVVVRPREEALLGALQSPSRTLERGAARLTAGEGMRESTLGLRVE